MAEGGKEINERLEAIQSELCELREAFDSFSNGGFPLRQEVATPETLAVLAAFVALSNMDLPVDHGELQARVNSAMVLGTDLLRVYESYRHQTEIGRLDQLVR